MEHRSPHALLGVVLPLAVGVLLVLESAALCTGATAVPASPFATATLPCGRGAGSSQETPLPCGTPLPTPTWTPTSLPGPPELIYPADGVTMTQPVSPSSWYFSWWARMGPCYCTISIRGPGGRTISAQVGYGPSGYSYTYTSTAPLPDDALMPWFWDVGVHCPQGDNQSETRTFSVWPAGRFWNAFLPIVQCGR